MAPEGQKIETLQSHSPANDSISGDEKVVAANHVDEPQKGTARMAAERGFAATDQYDYAPSSDTNGN